MDRRAFLSALAAGLLSGSAGVQAFAQAAQPIDAPVPPGADFDSIVQMARQVAGSAFVPHKADLAPPFAGLGYDAFRAIRPRRSPLGTRTGFAFDLLPPGFVYQTPVTIAQVTDGLSREIPFSIDEFEFDQRYFDPQAIAAARQAGPDLGYSGFRLRSRINRVDVLDEFAVFQGASYFRAIARNMVYGLSARGLAIGTGSPTGEEFPVFRAFWIVTPAPADQKVLVRALLDSPSCAGAFEFEITPGETTAMQIRCTLFPRSEITEIGIAPLTSMYLFGPGRRARVDDFRNGVHDSEGLQMITGDGERLWRPLNNPRRVQISAFQDNNPKGFGLSQRHRDFDHYQDDEAHYEKRPSAWVEPIDDWGEGAVVLVEIPTDSEFNDNIVAFWRPRAPIGPTDVGHQIAYRLLWSASAPDSGPLGRVIATRTGVAVNDGNRRIMVVDFSRETPWPNQIEVDAGVNTGAVLNLVIRRLSEDNRMRVTFEFVPGQETALEFHMRLVGPDGPETEKWLYRWTAA
jgi:glucans biosynthesis protein